MKPPKEPVANIQDGRKTFTMPVITDCERRDAAAPVTTEKNPTPAPLVGEGQGEGE